MTLIIIFLLLLAIAVGTMYILTWHKVFKNFKSIEDKVFSSVLSDLEKEQKNVNKLK